MSRIFLYCRVSHKSSADSGISIQNQIKLGSNYCNTILPGLPLYANAPVVDQGVSGWRKPLASRPGGRVVAEEAVSGDHVVCYSIDRLSRNLRDFCNTTHYWDRQGVAVHYIADQINTSTAAGRLFANIKAGMAQYASDLISERTREAFLIKEIEAGKPISKRTKAKWLDSPYGLSVPIATPDRPHGKVHVYTRVSSSRQYTSGLGLKRQEEVCLKEAKRLVESQGSCPGGMFREPAISAFSKKFHERPQGKKLLDAIAPGDDVVIYRSDRAWRSPADAVQMCEHLKERGAYLHLVMEGIHSDTDQGTEWVSLLSSIAHLESTMKSRRVREIHGYLQSHGRSVGQTPKGFSVRQVSPGVKKLVSHNADSVRLAGCWLIKHELGLTWKQQVETLNAWEWMKGDSRRKVSLKNFKKHSTTAIERQINNLKERYKNSPRRWEALLQEARDKYYKPIPAKYWKMFKWEWPFNAGQSRSSESSVLGV